MFTYGKYTIIVFERSSCVTDLNMNDSLTKVMQGEDVQETKRNVEATVVTKKDNFTFTISDGITTVDLEATPKASKKMEVGQTVKCFNVERQSPVKLKMNDRSHVKILKMSTPPVQKPNLDLINLASLMGRPENVVIKEELGVKVLMIEDIATTSTNKTYR